MVFNLDSLRKKKDIKGIQEVKKGDINGLDVLVGLKVYWNIKVY